VLPFTIPSQVEAYNTALLLKLLNGDQCFHVDMKPRKNDVLELHFTFPSTPGKASVASNSGSLFMAYCFAFHKKSWHEMACDPFRNNLKAVTAGKIAAAF